MAIEITCQLRDFLSKGPVGSLLFCPSSVRPPVGRSRWQFKPHFKESGGEHKYWALGHVAYKKSTSIYIAPVQSRGFSFSEQRSDLGWIEVKRKGWEVGPGIGAALGSNFIAVGLAPYKGARQVMARHKKTQNEVTPSPKLPDDTNEVRNWSLGDRGSFQRYGVVQV